MNQPKTIAFTIGSLARGGAERVTINLMEHFYAQGYTIYLITKLRVVDEYHLMDGIVRIDGDLTPEELTKSRIRNLFKRIRKLRKIWREYSPDLIVSFIGKNNLMTLVSSIRLKTPVITTICSDPKSEYESRFMWRVACGILPLSRGVVVKTKHAILDFPKKIQKKAIALPNPLHEQFVVEHLPVMRKNEIVAVGRLDENKNQKLLIDAFAKIAEEYPQWTCHIYGDGECRDELERYVNNLSCRKQIEFHGQSSHIADDIYHASIYALTSRVEGMPNALMEAMALGIACISTDCPCGGPSELITQGENGFLIPVDGEEELAHRLQDLMVHSHKCEMVGQKAWERMQEYYPQEALGTWQNYLESLMQ
ncbi:MAG: glycosyltransferase [Eubacteriales bacterium]